MWVSSSSSPFSSSSSLGRRTMMIRTESRKFSERVPVVTQLLWGKKGPYRVLSTTTTKRRLFTATTLVSWSPLFGHPPLPALLYLPLTLTLVDRLRHRIPRRCPLVLSSLDLPHPTSSSCVRVHPWRERGKRAKARRRRRRPPKKWDRGG